MWVLALWVVDADSAGYYRMTVIATSLRATPRNDRADG